jgi:MFS transporter, DHA1 family, inner membrane transport protein
MGSAACPIDDNLSVSRKMLLLAILAIGSATSFTNYGLLAPLLKAIAADFGVSDGAVGQLATLHAIASAATLLVITPWMDRFGRGRLLAFGATLLFAGTVSSALAPTFAWLFPARLVAGIGAALILPVCFAAAGDLYPDARKRTQAVAVIVSATALAPLIAFPILTQINAMANWRWAVAALLVPLAVLIAGSFGLPAHATTRRRMAGRRDYARHYRALLGNPETNWLLVGSLVRGVSWSSSMVYLGAFAVATYGLDANRLSLLFVTLGGVFLIATNVVPLVTRLISVRQLYVGSIVALLVNFSCAGLIAGEWGLFLFVVLLGIAGPGTFVAESVLLLDSYPSARGGVMSLNGIGSQVSTAAGAALTALILVLTDDYASAYRVLGLLLPVTVLALVISSRSRRMGVVEPDAALVRQ